MEGKYDFLFIALILQTTITFEIFTKKIDKFGTLGKPRLSGILK